MEGWPFTAKPDKWNDRYRWCFNNWLWTSVFVNTTLSFLSLSKEQKVLEDSLPLRHMTNIIDRIYVYNRLPDCFSEPTFLCSLHFNREEEAVVQGGRSYSGPAEPQARPRRVPTHTHKHPQSCLHLCVQHNQWQHAELSSDGQQHSLLCVLLLTELRCGQQIGPLPNARGQDGHFSKTLT